MMLPLKKTANQETGSELLNRTGSVRSNRTGIRPVFTAKRAVSHSEKKKKKPRKVHCCSIEHSSPLPKAKLKKSEPLGTLAAEHHRVTTLHHRVAVLPLPVDNQLTAAAVQSLPSAITEPARTSSRPCRCITAVALPPTDLLLANRVPSVAVLCLTWRKMKVKILH
ncbi:hypothetical protein PIB30_012271 [Stylosanthes scabra]|uniref:Uncharacterized protein n=1 Tax=Stylosanthes scabra TaxID=79078 RepID=A0ABU6X482_9FABA|nr:hypothetical protein [Stylosanthes scabra]